MENRISINGILSRGSHRGSSSGVAVYPLYTNYTESYNFRNISDSIRKWNSFSRSEDNNISKMVELLECVNKKGDKSQIDSVSSLIAENVSYIKNIDYLSSMTKDNAIISEAVKVNKIYDSILENHKLLSKRFNIESNLRSVGEKDLPSAIFEMCSFIDTYEFGLDTKIKMALDEAAYVTTKVGLKYPMSSIVEDVSTYFMTQRKDEDEFNEMLDIIESVALDDEFIEEQDCSFLELCRDVTTDKILNTHLEYSEAADISALDEAFNKSSNKSVGLASNIFKAMKGFNYSESSFKSIMDKICVWTIKAAKASKHPLAVVKHGAVGISAICRMMRKKAKNNAAMIKFTSNIVMAYANRLGVMEKSASRPMKSVYKSMAEVYLLQAAKVAATHESYEYDDPITENFDDLKMDKPDNTRAIAEFKMSKKTDDDFKTFVEAVASKPKTVEQAKATIGDILGMGKLGINGGSIINIDVISNCVLKAIERMTPTFNQAIDKAIIKEFTNIGSWARIESYNTDKDKSAIFTAISESCKEGILNYNHKTKIIKEATSFQVKSITYDEMLESMQSILEGMSKAESSDINGLDFVLYNKEFYKSIPLKDITPVSTYIFGHFDTLDIDIDAMKSAMSDASWELRKLPRNKANTERIYALANATNKPAVEESVDIEDKDAVVAYLNEVADGNRILMESIVAVNELSISSHLKMALNKMVNTVKGLDTKITVASNAVDSFSRLVSHKLDKSMEADNRESVIRGDILPSMSRCIKLACAAGVLCIINPALALVGLVVQFVMSSRGKAKEKQLVLNELDVELTMVDKYIQADEEKKDMKRLREHLLLKKKLQSQYARLKYNIKIEWNDSDVHELRGKNNDND